MLRAGQRRPVVEVDVDWRDGLMDKESRESLGRTLWSLIPEEMRPEHWRWRGHWSPRRPWWIPQFPLGTEEWSLAYWWMEEKDPPVYGSLHYQLAFAERIDFDRAKAQEAWTTVAESELAASTFHFLPVWLERGVGSTLAAGLEEEYGWGAAEAFERYATARRTGSRIAYAEAYLAFLDTLPPSDSVLAEKVQAVLGCGDTAWAAAHIEPLLNLPECPLWLRAAGAFGWPVSDDFVDHKRSRPEWIALDCAGPDIAFAEFVFILPAPLLPLEAIDIEAVWGLATLELPADLGVEDEPIWGIGWWLEPEELSGMERPTFLVSAAVVAWLLRDADLQPSNALDERLPLLVAATRVLLDAAISAGLGASAEIAWLLLDALRLLRDDEGSANRSMGTQALDASIEAVAVICGALPVLTSPRVSLRSLESPEPLADLIRLLPNDVVLGGEATPDAMVARFDEMEARLLTHAPLPAGDAGTIAKERALLCMAEHGINAQALGWDLDENLCNAMGLPNDVPPLIAGAARANALEAVLHRTFPALPSQENFTTLADKLGTNVRTGALRVLTADEGRRVWMPVLQAAAMSRNRLMHPRDSAAATDAHRAFWLPERYPPGASKHTVFELLALLAEAQRRRE